MALNQALSTLVSMLPAVDLAVAEGTSLLTNSFSWAFYRFCLGVFSVDKTFFPFIYFSSQFSSIETCGWKECH